MSFVLCMDAVALAGAQLAIGQTPEITANSALYVGEKSLGAPLRLDVTAFGGVNGNRIELRMLEDQVNADNAVANVKSLAKEEQVLALFMICGTRSPITPACATQSSA